jgi:hypothetical protein
MHYIHLGHVGLVANFRWGEIADFILGWSTLDFAHDDGQQFSHWGWQPAHGPSAE